MDHRGLGGVNKARLKVYLETQETEISVFQNFRLVASEFRFLRYFTDEMFLGYHILSSEMEKYYAGDGERIVFRSKITYNNLISVIFDKLEKVKINNNLTAAQFEVEAPIPKSVGCLDCENFRKSNRVCSFYQTILLKLKTSCPDFRQKEINYGPEKED